MNNNRTPIKYVFRRFFFVSFLHFYSLTFQIIPSPAGPVGTCPSPMMHSPMQGVQGVQGGPQGYGMGSNQGPN